MSFVGVNPFRPVRRTHPLAKAPAEPSEVGKSFIPPPPDVALARSMQDAVGRYPDLNITPSLAEEWINEAKTFKGYEYLSASMLVATFVLMFLAHTSTPTQADVLKYYSDVMEPYQDIRLTPNEQDDLRIHQLADLWRYTKKVIALREPPSQE